jgi:ribonuclease P protein component
VFQQGRHNSGRLLALRSVPNDLGWTRCGFVVSKRVGKAVVRNRVRRRLREIVRSAGLREGYDLVVSARPEAAAGSFDALRQETQLLMRRARLIDDTAE